MTRAALLIFALSAPAFAADHSFDQVVKGIETHYGTRRSHIPLMGLANFVMKVGKPAGTSSLHIAVFQDLDESPDYGDQADLDRLMDSVDKGSLHPMIRVRSQRDGESTYIYAGDIGKSTRLLVATFQRREATVVEVKVNIETLMRLMENPANVGKMFGVGQALSPANSSNDRFE